MATLTRWLLRIFADKWSGGLDSDDMVLVDRNDAVILDVNTANSPTTLTRGRPKQDFDLTTGNVLGVALTADDQPPTGLGGTEYNPQPTLTVRIEGASTYENGFIDTAETFRNIIDEAQDIVRNIDNGDLQNAPFGDMHVAEPEGQSPQMADHAEYFRYDFDVSVQGYRTI